jgi:hypothetical protein
MWSGQDTTTEIEAKVAALRKVMQIRGLDLRWSEPRSSILEAALGRGDRRLNAVVIRAWRSGARFDAWNEHFSYERWQAAFEAEGLDAAWYAQRDIPIDEPLPWDHLGCGVTRDFLARDYRRAMSGETLADCHWGPCYNCGVPAATGFECQSGEQGPRRLLRAQSSNPETGGVQADERSAGRWRYMGPPGDPRRQMAPQVATPDTTDRGARESSPYKLKGTQVQSKSAGPSGLASLVEAAGGESSG